MKPRRFASATTFSISWSLGTVKLAPYAPPGEPAARAGRPPHMVGRRNASSILPTRRARCAGWPTSPHGGEAKCKLDTPHPASPLRRLAHLPTWWGGEMQTRYSPPGEPAARAGRPPQTVGRRNANSILPTQRARCAGWPTSPHVGRQNANSILPTQRARCAGWPTSPHGGEAKCKLDTPHPASPLGGLADLPTRWGG